MSRQTAMPHEPFLQPWAGEKSGCSVCAQTSTHHRRDSRAVLYHSHTLYSRSGDSGPGVSLSKSVLPSRVSLQDSTGLGCTTVTLHGGKRGWRVRFCPVLDSGSQRAEPPRGGGSPSSSAASLLRVQWGERWWPTRPTWVTGFWCQGQGAGGRQWEDSLQCTSRCGTRQAENFAPNFWAHAYGTVR